ncbi:MAG: adenosylcobinamide-GDP ribazoletransferase [Spirochaetes bacterium]|nr:adenosylcobinamide-GDP ribazoletransferase [Spirochaetota bacterium]
MSGKANKGVSLARFLSVFTLMTRVPVRRPFKVDFSQSDFWIPAISPLVSLASIAGFAAGMALSGSLILSTVVSLALQYFLFNLFHFDGLVDTADALLPVATREKRLEILKDPRLGTYAFFTGLLVLTAKVGVIAMLAEEGIMFSALAAGLLAAPVAGRTAAALVALKCKPARTDGLGSLMRDFSGKRLSLGALVGALPALVFSALAGSWPLALFCAAAIVLSATLSALFVGHAYEKALGGFTGDALGAAIELGELGTLIILGITLRFLGGVPL